jgi:hypothetical protein
MRSHAFEWNARVEVPSFLSKIGSLWVVIVVHAQYRSASEHIGES